MQWDPIKVLFSGPISTMCVRCLGLAGNFAALSLVAHFLDQQSLGVVIILNGIGFVGGTICAFGIQTHLQKAMAGSLLMGSLGGAAAEYYRALKVVGVSFTVLLALSLAGVIAQGRGVLPSDLGGIGQSNLVALCCCSGAMAIQFMGIAAIRALRRPVLSSFFQFCTQPVLLLAVLLPTTLAFGGSALITTWAVVLAVALNSGMVALVAGLLLKGGSKDEVLPSLDWAEVRQFWYLGLLSAASSNIPLLAAAFFLTAEEVPAIGIPFRVCNLPMTVVAALGGYYAPVIRESVLRGDLTAQRGSLRESQWIGVCLVLPLLVATIFFPKTVIGVFKIEDNNAVAMLLIFSLAQLIIAGCGVIEQCLNMSGLALPANKITFGTLMCMVVSLFHTPEWFASYWIAFVWAVFSVIRQIGLLLIWNNAHKRRCL